MYYSQVQYTKVKNETFSEMNVNKGGGGGEEGSIKRGDQLRVSERMLGLSSFCYCCKCLCVFELL